MKKFTCSSCQNGIFFENVLCSHCSHPLSFDSETLSMHALSPADEADSYHVIGEDESHQPGPRSYCTNHDHGACNWLTPAGTTGLCQACGMNRTIPNLMEPGSHEAWANFEHAKKRLIYQLLRMRLAFDEGTDGTSGLSFSFARGENTGHLDGEVSVDFKEADVVWRESQRQAFNEPYRSLLGHLRHETGHYFWMRLIEQSNRIDAFRDLFGDEREDYAAAIARHHDSDPPADWPDHYVSAYASAHPWEDWAETWAHYLHMVDALETAQAWSISPGADRARSQDQSQQAPKDIYRDEDFDSLVRQWVPLTIALNSLSRSMGHDDFYPFVISDNARTKLRFIHDAVRSAGTASAPPHDA